FQEKGRKKGATIATAWAAKKGIEFHKSSFSSSPLARARASVISSFSGGQAARVRRFNRGIRSACHRAVMIRRFLGSSTAAIARPIGDNSAHDRPARAFPHPAPRRRLRDALAAAVPEGPRG